VPPYLQSSCPSSWDDFSSGKVSFHYTLFFLVIFSSRVFHDLSNGSLASRIFSTSKKGHVGEKYHPKTTKKSTF
jgi:hypothetical protein